MVSASNSGPDSDVSLGLSATQAGALILMSKPNSPSSPQFESERDQLLKMAKAMAAVKVVRRWGSRTTPIAVPVAKPARAGARRLVAIGTSTGGPAALHRVLLDLPRDFPAPILVVQHMAQGFIDGLAKWLGANIPLGATVATHGTTLAPGTVYLAPDDAHLGVTPDGQALLARAAPMGGFRPSADYLFDSCARAYGPAAVGVILTGMGSDGTQGLKMLHARGGRVIAQDEASSVVFGMAQQAIAAGAVDEVIPLDRIGRRIAELVEASV
jgi:two-component system chemotaxis response regulator CheB